MNPAAILIVDDEPANLSLLMQLLRPTYQVRAANSGANALRAAACEPRPDLMPLDFMMRETDGGEVLARLRNSPATADIPVIIVTALADVDEEERGLALGTADYLAKPIKPVVVLARVRTPLEAEQTRDWLKDQNATLEAEVSPRMVENDLTQLVGIRTLAPLAETRDAHTGNHILRTQSCVRALALRFGQHPRFSAAFDSRTIDRLAKSAPLHDIGKDGIPDSILLKPGPLTPKEWLIMKTHSRLGSDAIEQAKPDVEQPIDFLVLVKEVALWHHERWGGSGYPDGLKGEETPVSERLMAVADVFDAVISPRVYKPAMSHERASEIIFAGSGGHFHPDGTAAFLNDFDVMTAIAGHYQERGTPEPQ